MQPVAESVRNMVEADIADVMGVLPGGENSKSPNQLNTIKHKLHWGYRGSD